MLDDRILDQLVTRHSDKEKNMLDTTRGTTLDFDRMAEVLEYPIFFGNASQTYIEG